MNLRQNIKNLKHIPTSNSTKNRKIFVITYTRKKRKHYEPLHMKNVLDKKIFWKRMKSFFSDETTIFSQISIEKNNKIISDDFDLSVILKI